MGGYCFRSVMGNASQVISSCSCPGACNEVKYVTSLSAFRMDPRRVCLFKLHNTFRCIRDRTLTQFRAVSRPVMYNLMDIFKVQLDFFPGDINPAYSYQADYTETFCRDKVAEDVTVLEVEVSSSRVMSAKREVTHSTGDKIAFIGN